MHHKSDHFEPGLFLMFIRLSTLTDLPGYPKFNVDGIPAGHTEPVIYQKIHTQILETVRAGEEVEPVTQRAHDYENVNGVYATVSRLRWSVTKARRATPFGELINKDLRADITPRFTVEQVILHTPADSCFDQEIRYKFVGHDDIIPAACFAEPQAVRSFSSGVVASFNGQLTFFPFSGISELARSEATGESMKIIINPTQRGVLSFALYAQHCLKQADQHHYAWRYNDLDSKEAWIDAAHSTEVLTGTRPYNPETFTPLVGRFRIRTVEGGVVLDGFAANDIRGDCGMMDRKACERSVERLCACLAGYTPQRTEHITRLAEAIADGFDPISTDAETAKARLADLCFLVRKTIEDHKTASVADYWEPAAQERARLAEQGTRN